MTFEEFVASMINRSLLRESQEVELRRAKINPLHANQGYQSKNSCRKP